MKTSCLSRTYEIRGTVQGVGFRPAIYNYAESMKLGGWIQNRSGTVRLNINGPADSIDNFINGLSSNIPEHAAIEHMELLEEEKADRPVKEFEIIESDSGDDFDMIIPADLAICRDCSAEIMDPGDRRYGYPFTTCVNCGPRYTVINSTPYDRERTTMKEFPLCSKCTLEYENPADRRFHAESIACPVCGPSIALCSPLGKILDVPPLRSSRKLLHDGKILAVRGIGGYLLAANPFSREAVTELRQRKTRPDKPFALMARDIGAVRKYCRLSETEESLLESCQAPIVILDILEGAADLPTELLSPDTRTLGIMLPTSPLHKLLFEQLKDDPTKPFDLLVMTSGNRGGEPICINNNEAFKRLAGIADAFLTHNREINLRNDDSICMELAGESQIWRRARGYAPHPITLNRELDKSVLAMGSEIKNTVAVGYSDKVLISPHIGDLESPEAVDGMEMVVKNLPEFLDVDPEVIAVDLHPDMHSTVLGRRLAESRDLPVVEVQHHEAHAAACLAEHGCDSGLALVFDGTGLGSDGTIWGAELFSVEDYHCERIATFSAVPLPGGDTAVREPIRQVAGRLHDAGVDASPALLSSLGVSESDWHAMIMQSEKRINCPLTHSAGRLFDACSAALGFAPEKITYDAQAAIRLEAAAMGSKADIELPFMSTEVDNKLVIDWSETFRVLSSDQFAGSRNCGLAMSFHEAVARAAIAMIEYGLERSSENTVALSGGVFMNRILNRLLLQALSDKGIEALVHSDVPPNDGCISFGQAVIAGMKKSL